ncbi:MAG: hypothetical protein MUO94_08285 [Thermoplasmata archaeon]|nr:hypothetical protein [Thermoplasmata archaeon]
MHLGKSNEDDEFNTTHEPFASLSNESSWEDAGGIPGEQILPMKQVSCPMPLILPIRASNKGTRAYLAATRVAMNVNWRLWFTLLTVGFVSLFILLYILSCLGR